MSKSTYSIQINIGTTLKNFENILNFFILLAFFIVLELICGINYFVIKNIFFSWNRYIFTKGKESRDKCAIKRCDNLKPQQIRKFNKFVLANIKKSFCNLQLADAKTTQSSVLNPLTIYARL